MFQAPKPSQSVPPYLGTPLSRLNATMTRAYHGDVPARWEPMNRGEDEGTNSTRQVRKWTGEITTYSENCQHSTDRNKCQDSCSTACRRHFLFHHSTKRHGQILFGTARLTINHPSSRGSPCPNHCIFGLPCMAVRWLDGPASLDWPSPAGSAKYTVTLVKSNSEDEQRQDSCVLAGRMNKSGIRC